MEKLHALSPLPLEIIWHENRTSYLSMYRLRGKLVLKLHRLFMEAPSPVLEALIRVAFDKRDMQARSVVRKMAHLYFSKVRLPPKELPTKGETYNLEEVFRDLKIRYFAPGFSSTIGWAKQPRKSRLCSVTFGCYDSHRDQIRISPLLDHADVPLYFLEFIVYHEMLHAIIPAKIDSRGRCLVHTPEFRAKEREFPHYQAAKEWEKMSLKIFKKRNAPHGRA